MCEFPCFKDVDLKIPQIYQNFIVEQTMDDDNATDDEGIEKFVQRCKE